MKSWAIDTHDLTKSYGEIDALKSLNLKVARNSIFGFLGPNGAGKTTTIKLLLGLTRPTRGGGTMFGRDIVEDSVDIRKRIGYLAQNPSYYRHMTARQTLRFRAGFFYRGPKSEVEDRIEETLMLVGLAGKADRPIKGFSGGELQRLGIAQAQVTYPDLLILDEPAANLDPRGRKDVLEVMARLRKYTTVFYSTHILDDVQQVSDTIAILNHGELVAQAPLEQLLVGSSGSVYSVELKGEIEKARVRVASQPWVSGIQGTHKNGTERWLVSVTDEAAAQSELLRLVLAEPSTSVIEFGLKKYDLEEVFLSVVEGGQDVQQ